MMNVDLNNVPLEVMDTPNKRMVGMMGRNHLEGAMVFPFDEVSERSFWMKNCKIPLDMVFVIDNIIKDTFKNVPPCVEGQECTKDFNSTANSSSNLYSMSQVMGGPKPEE